MKKKAKGATEYIFVTHAMISFSTKVHADSLEEAIEIAQSRAVQTLCHQCCGGDDDEWGTELDSDGPGKLVELHVGDSSFDSHNPTAPEWTEAAEAFDS